MSGRKKTREVNILEVSLVALSLCKLFAVVLLIQAYEHYVESFFLVFNLERHILWGNMICLISLSFFFLETNKKVLVLPIWLCNLNAMSNCRMTSINWNQGLISLSGKGMWTENTMLLATIFLAMASSKFGILSHWFGPRDMNHFVSCRCLTVSTHLMAT